MALSGGRTPRSLYETISSAYGERIDWDRVLLFWGDERFVLNNHHESNYRMAAESLISRIPIPTENVFPVPTREPTASLAAEAYEKVLRTVFIDEKYPRFDLLLLGLGADGHVASLFRGSAALKEKSRWVVAATAPEPHAVRERITVTFPVINSARTVVMLVAGEEKRKILEDYSRNAESYPAGFVKPAGRFFIFTDIRVQTAS